MVSSSRFLTAPTYIPPPGKTTGAKKAKAMVAAASRVSKKRAPPNPPGPSEEVVVAAELIAKSVLEFKSEIAKLARCNQDQQKLDKVNTLIRLGMTEEAVSSMAFYIAQKKKEVQEVEVVHQPSRPTPAPVCGATTSPAPDSPCSNQSTVMDGGSVNLLLESEEEELVEPRWGQELQLYIFFVQ